MPTTLAFDVYGTLIDTNGVVVTLEKLIGNKASAFSQTWRNKQLEYSFRRALMQNYEPFDICTSQALDYACVFHGISLTKTGKDELMDSYLTLPAFDDVREGLARLKENGFRLFAFSNGKKDALKTLLTNAGIRDMFLDLVSVHDIKTFKPAPETYDHLLRQVVAEVTNTWLVSSNPFDIMGAISTGMKGAWIQRTSKNIFDPWGPTPTLTVGNLMKLGDRIDMQ